MNRSTLLITLLLTTAACSDSSMEVPVDQGGDAASDSVAPSDDASTSKLDAGTDTGTEDAPSNDNDAGTEAGMDSSVPSPVDNSDGFGTARAACIAEINKLRATESHTAYTLWDTPAVDMCVDQQATYDQSANSAHDAWINKVYPTCNGNAQDECLGYGTDAAAVVACLDAMWNERLQSNCSGCPACNGPKLTSTVFKCQSTSTCDFYGNYGSECGHYINMSADYFSYAACGFSTSGKSGWAVQNFK